MATLTKEKKGQAQSMSFALADYNSVYTFVELLEYMEKFGFIDANDKKREEFKAKVIELMYADGVSEAYIKKYLTDAAIENALINDFSAEDLAWSLLR